MPLINIMLGEVVFGGVGAGLYGIFVFVVLAVFIAGLMVGRTPEYFGKKIEGYDVKMAMLAVLVLTLAILGFSALAAAKPFGTSSISNPGPHGLSQILYAYASSTGNNGSAFAGINANTKWYNTSYGIAQLLRRLFMIIPIMAIAGAAQEKNGAGIGGDFSCNRSPLCRPVGVHNSDCWCPHVLSGVESWADSRTLAHASWKGFLRNHEHIRQIKAQSLADRAFSREQYWIRSQSCIREP